ncbi:hypothetical protein [Shinella zoogloeoides]|uniref:hypothetical protein n=1 Tax=Shinella zoogloeoides TaxID=352475 RepID=UPI0028AF9B5B|nr:hypothetical protein [Shinella zoogloeoides]
MPPVPALILATLALMALMSGLAVRRIAPGAERLTMQWKRDGRPNWSLPRHAALAFTPVLATAMLALVAIRGGTAMAMLPLCAAFIGAHALHLFLLARRGG